MRMFASSLLFSGALLMGTSGLTAQTNNTWHEQWFQAKYGRSSPMEEARRNAEAANTAFREETTTGVAAPANAWYEQWYQLKYGRSSPMK